MHDTDIHPPTIDKQELKSIFSKNSTLPHFSIQEFNLADGLFENNGVFDGLPIQQVPVEQIVASSSMRNWGDLDDITDQNHIDSLIQSYQLLQKNGKLPDYYSLKLNDWDGAYTVVDGQKRVMAAKALGIQTLPSRVIRVFPTTISLPTENLYTEMQNRQNLGLWKGGLNFSLDENGSYSGGKAIVQSYEGVWVFAKNMELVKKVCQSIGVSGQAELFI